MKKLMEVVKRQTELSAKAAAGTATKDEIAELNKLNAVLKAAVEPAPASDTKLATMTLAEFRVWHEKAVEQVEAGEADASLLAIVKRNVAAVKSQGKTKPEDIVAVELPVEKQEPDRVAALEAKLADLESKLAEKANKGAEGAPPDGGAAPAAEAAPAGGAAPDAAPDPDAAKAEGDKPVSQALAIEAIDALLARYTKVKAAVDAGNLTRQDLELLWSDYELKRCIEQAAAIMAKADELKAAAEAVLPELQKMEAAEKKAAEGTPDPEGGEPGAEAGAEGETEKGSGGTGGPSRWESGLDMSPSFKDSREQAQAIKAVKNKHGF